MKETIPLVHSRMTILVMGALALSLPACSSLTLEHVNYGWPVESPLTVSAANTVEDVRYALMFPVGGLAMAEFADSTALRGMTLRVIRNHEGFYFITGPGFKHVYVFTAGTGTLVQSSAIDVSETGLVSPALNLRPPYIELIDGGSNSRMLTSSDIVEGRK